MSIPLMVLGFCLGFVAGSIWQAFWSDHNRREVEMLDELWNGEWNGDDDLAQTLN